MRKLLSMIAMFFILVGALNWLLIGAIGVNLLQKCIGRGPARAVYIVVGVCALSLIFYRDTYLPFLGETAMPCDGFPDHIPEGADTQVEVRVTPNVKVLYWAASSENEKFKEVKNWKDAYLKYSNSGIVKANADGLAILNFLRPQSYRVPIRGVLNPHVHYRECNSGMMGRVETVDLAEGFV